jgi:antitoxin CcdA
MQVMKQPSQVLPKAAKVARETAEKRAQRWARENHAAIASSNAFVEQHGLPLAKYRTF